jgi:uncharacterized protein YkwD
MNRAKLFLGGVMALFSLQAAPALARPAAPYNGGYNGSHGSGYNGGYDDSYGQSQQAYFHEALEQRVLELVNSVRARYGLNDLRADFRGQKAARDLAEQAGLEGGFGRVRDPLEDRLYEQGIDTRDREFGEVKSFARQNNDTEALAKAIVKAWFKNSRQASLLLSEDLSYAGVAAYANYDGQIAVVLDAYGPKNVVVTPPPAPTYGGCNKNSSNRY